MTLNVYNISLIDLQTFWQHIETLIISLFKFISVFQFVCLAYNM